MKNLLLIFNVILLFAVGFLFYKQFSRKFLNENKNFKSCVADSTLRSHSRLAWLDVDSLQNNYEYYKILKSSFEKKQQAGNNELESIQNKDQQEASQLQQKAQTMTQQEQQAAMAKINEMQQDLQARKQQLDNDLFEASAKMKEDILKRVQNFLKDYNKDKRFDYIFSYEPGFMFYKDSTLDITKDVIVGLNDLYQKSQQ
jgi:outer membrane protein